MAASKERIRIFDVLKGICILFILITHFNWSDRFRLVYLFAFWIDMAVPVFMMISGYLYSLSLDKIGASALEDGYDMVFVIKKIVRYTVPFAFAWLFEMIYYFRQGMEMPSGGGLRLFVTGGAGPGSYYFPILIQLIFVMPLIYYVIKRTPLKGLFCCFLVNLVYEFIQNAYGLNESTYRLLIFRYIFLLAVGCYLYVAGADSLFANKKRRWILVGCMAVGVLFITAYSYLHYEPRVIVYWTGTSCIAALYIFPIFAFVFKRFGGIKNRFFEWLGRSSYEIFLTQMVFYQFFAKYIYADISSRILQLVTCVAISLLIGLAYHFVMEKWVMKFCMNKTEKGAMRLSQKWKG